MRQWSIPETDQMRIQPYKGWILRTCNQRRKNLYGPRKAKRNQRLANPYNSQANLRIFRIWSFYRRFIWHFLELAKPLNDLLKKDQTFEWTDDHQKAFDELKKRFTEEPVLMMPDQSQPFQIKRGSSHSVGFKWWQTPSLLYFKNIFTGRKELWNLWSGITCDH